MAESRVETHTRLHFTWTISRVFIIIILFNNNILRCVHFYFVKNRIDILFEGRYGRTNLYIRVDDYMNQEPMLYSAVPTGVILGEGQIRLPAYLRVEQSIRRDIEQAKWLPGDMIPSEAQLSAIHNVSIGTVKKALHNLVTAGFLYRIQGKGTYVAGSFLRCEKLRFYRNQPAFYQPEPPYSAHFIACKIIPPVPTANAALKIAMNAKLIRLTRMMRMDNKPFVLIESYFAAERFPSLVNESPSRFEKQALTLIIENDYATPTMATQELVSAIPVDASLAERLELPAGSPMLLIEMVSFTYKDDPYEYRMSYCVPGKKIFRAY